MAAHRRVLLCSHTGREYHSQGIQVSDQVQRAYHSLGAHDAVYELRLVNAALQLPNHTRQSLIAVTWHKLIQPAQNEDVVVGCALKPNVAYQCLNKVYPKKAVLSIADAKTALYI